MNLKKLFAAVAGVSLLANTLIPAGVVGAASYGTELESAYAYAYGVGATTQYPIENANIYGAITRAELAKVISNWANKVLGVEADTSITPSFSDIASLRTSDLYDAVIRATQMGLMGQGVTAFRPYDTVTRAEFWTILSRALWGAQNDGGTPYYAAHLNALKNDGIMTQISDPTMKEIRGYVFIMLQRVGEKYDTTTPAQCKDPLVMLACALGSADCPAACKEGGETPTDPTDPTVKAGDLAISVDDYTSSVKSAPAVGTLIFNTIKFASSEAITVTSIQLERMGLSSRSDIKGVWFEKDGIQVSTKGTVSTDSKVSVNFTKGFTVKSSETLDLVVELSGSVGSEIAFKFIGVDSSARAATYDVQTTTYRTSSYNVAKVEFANVGNVTTGNNYTLGTQTEYTFGQFSIANYNTNSDDKAIVVRSILLRNNGNADLSNLLTKVRVLRDGTDVTNSVSIDGRNLTISFNDTIEGGKRVTYTIVSQINALDRIGDTVQLELRNATDLVAYEKATGFRTRNEFPTIPGNGYLNGYTINGGRVQFSNTSGFPRTVEAGSGATEVVIASGTLLLAEPIKLGTSDFTIATGVIRNLTIEFGGSRYSASKSTSGTVDLFHFEEIYINSSTSVPVKLIASLEANPNQTSASFTPSVIQGSASQFYRGEYLNNGEPLYGNTIAGAIQIATISVKTPQFSLKNNSSTTQRVVANSTETRTILDGTISSSKGSISLNSLILKPTITSIGLSSANTKVYLYFYIDGVGVGNAEYIVGTTNEITVTPSGIGAITDTAKTIKVEANITTRNETGSVTFDLTAKGTDTNGNEAVSSKATSAILSVVDAASISVSNSSAGSSVRLEGSNSELTRFSTTIKDGSITLDKIVLTGSWPDLSGQTVYLAVGNDTRDGIVTSASQIEFNGMNLTLSEGTRDLIFTTNIVTDGLTGGAASTGDGGLKITVNSIALYDDINTSTPLATRNITATYLFTKGYPTLTQVSKGNDYVTIRVTNGSNSVITLSNPDGIEVEKTGTGTVALNGQNNTKESIHPGGYVDIRFTVDPSSSIKLKALNYSVDDSSEYKYHLVDTYTNIGSWADFSISRGTN